MCMQQFFGNVQIIPNPPSHVVQKKKNTPGSQALQEMNVPKNPNARNLAVGSNSSGFPSFSHEKNGEYHHFLEQSHRTWHDLTEILRCTKLITPFPLMRNIYHYQWNMHQIITLETLV